VTSLDQNTPLSADQLRGLESMCAALHGASETDPVVKEVAWRTFALISAHRVQCSEMARLTETAYNQARMLSEITDACVAAEAEAERLRVRRGELTSLLNDPDRLADHLMHLRAILSEADRDAEIDRLADGGDV
jgi:hypothetical protein